MRFLYVGEGDGVQFQFVIMEVVGHYDVCWREIWKLF